jgi:DNA-binding MarR family transcriptional regulator
VTPARCDLDPVEYRQIEEFRYQLRRFLNFSETAARAAEIEPQQHQALLVIKASDTDNRPTIGHIARRLLLKHHSAVGLVDRLQALRLVTRTVNPDDARQVFVRLTKKGERILQNLSRAHRTELEQTAPALIAVLRSITRQKRERVPAA